MQIDWLTVVAQIINFLLLVWLLKHFLYQPVIHAMDKREELISSRLSEAEQRKADALNAKKKHENAIDQIAHNKQALEEAAIESVGKQRQKLLADARKEVAKRQAEWHQQINRDASNFIRDLKLHSANAIQSVTQRMLTDVANTNLDTQMLNAFLELLIDLESEPLNAIKDSSSPVLVTTAKALDESERHRITATLHELLGVEKAIDYQFSPNLVSGIEMEVAGFRIGWNLRDYLDEMADNVAKQLEHVDALAH